MTFLRLSRWWLPCLSLVALAQGASPEFLLQNKPVRPEPFAESPLRLNPPTFRWPAENQSGKHRLELSRTPDFRHAKVHEVETLFFRPLQPLETGDWYWRVRREAPAPGPWSPTETFTISNELPKWPLEPWETWLERVPRSHPRTFLTAEELPALRENARRLGAQLEPWIKEIRKNLEAPFSLETYQSQVPPDADPFGPDSPSRKQLVWASKSAARAAIVPAAEAAWLWLATGDPWYVNRIRERALLVAEFDPEGFISERNTGNDLGNIDFGNAVIVHDLGLIYDLLYEELTEDERARIRRAIVARAEPMFRKMYRAPLELMRAHAWQHGFLDAMVGALAIYHDEPRAQEWVKLGLQSFVALYPWYGGNDGGSQEGPRYYYAVGAIPSLNTLDLFRSAFGLRLEDGNPWFHQNPYFLLYSFPPGGLQSQLGDSNPGRAGTGDDTLYPAGKGRIAALRMAAVHGLGYAAAYAAALPYDRAGYTISELLRWDVPSTVAPQSLEELPPARLFRDVGTVFLHSALARPEDNVRLIFHASPYGGHGHSHADQNSFHVIAYNEHLLLDSGYFTPTGDPHREQYYVRTMAHNTLLVDGTGQHWGDTTGYGRIVHFEEHPEWVAFTGDAAAAYHEAPLERFDRHVVWLRGNDVQTYVVFDDVVSAGDTPRTFDWLLHAAQEMEVDAQAQTVRVRGEKGETRVSFLTPGELSFTQKSGFNVPAIYWRRGQNFPLPDQWHLTARTSKAKEMQFVTVIQVSRRNAAKPEVRAVPSGAETAGWRVVLDPESRRVRVERVGEGAE